MRYYKRTFNLDIPIKGYPGILPYKGFFIISLRFRVESSIARDLLRWGISN